MASGDVEDALRLAHSLEGFDSAAKDHMRKLKEIVRHSALSDGFDALYQYVDRYDFEAALAQLESIVLSLNISLAPEGET